MLAWLPSRVMVALSESFSSCSPPEVDEIFNDFLSLSTFFTTPESSLLALALVPVPLELAVLVELWLEGIVLAELWLEGVVADPLWLEGVVAEPLWLEGVVVVAELWLEGVCVWLEVVCFEESVVLEELCCSARTAVTPTSPAAAMPMRSFFIWTSFWVGEWRS